MIKELSARECNPIFPVALAAAFVFFASIGVADAQSQKFQFAVIGDTGYSKRGEQEFEHMMAAMNREPLRFPCPAPMRASRARARRSSARRIRSC